MTPDMKTDKEILQDAFTNDGVKLLFGKLNHAADLLPLQAIQALLQDDIPKAKRCAYLWDAYKHQIPLISERIMNRPDSDPIIDTDAPEPKWSFFRWLFGSQKASCK